MDNNFLPNISCPYCGKKTVTSISGFGGQLSIRGKVCNHCGKEYNLVVYSIAEPNNEFEWDGRIKIYEDRIKYLKQQRKKCLAERLLEHRVYQKLNNETIEKAEEMQRKRSMN